jgi:hypothetical protein
MLDIIFYKYFAHSLLSSVYFLGGAVSIISVLFFFKIDVLLWLSFTVMVWKSILFILLAGYCAP